MSLVTSILFYLILNSLTLKRSFLTVLSQFLHDIKYWEIPCANPELSAYIFLIHVVTLTFQHFHVADKREVFLLTLRYFTKRNDIFFEKQTS